MLLGFHYAQSGGDRKLEELSQYGKTLSGLPKEVLKKQLSRLMSVLTRWLKHSIKKTQTYPWPI